jgi:hypothetical protein
VVVVAGAGIMITSSSTTTSVIAQSQPNTETPEAQDLIGNATTKFVICDFLMDSAKYYEQHECDHDILFLKGVCEFSNNGQDYCYDTNMVRYLNDKDINNAPRPPDTWCNMLPESCLAKYETLLESMSELTGEEDYTTPGIEEKMDELKEKIAAKED